MNKGIKRLGIIASVLWLTVGTIWFYGRTVNADQSSIYFRYNNCLDNSYIPSLSAEKIEAAKAACGEKFRTERDELSASLPARSGEAFLIAIALNVLGWLALWIVTGLTRWVGAGFNQSA